MLSGYPFSTAGQGALDAGAHGYLEKSDLVHGLIPRLERIIEGRLGRRARLRGLDYSPRKFRRSLLAGCHDAFLEVGRRQGDRLGERLPLQARTRGRG